MDTLHSPEPSALLGGRTGSVWKTEHKRSFKTQRTKGLKDTKKLWERGLLQGRRLQQEAIKGLPAFAGTNGSAIMDTCLPGAYAFRFRKVRSTAKPINNITLGLIRLLLRGRLSFWHAVLNSSSFRSCRFFYCFDLRSRDTQQL